MAEEKDSEKDTNNAENPAGQTKSTVSKETESKLERRKAAAAEAGKERLKRASEATKAHDDASSLPQSDAQKGVSWSGNASQADEESPNPVVVQRAGAGGLFGADPDDDPNVTSSARSAFWAQVGDGRVETSPDDYASNARQRTAFQQYEARPDIESRASILGRETADPGEYSPFKEVDSEISPDTDAGDNTAGDPV